MNVYKNIQLN